ncbi:hypothetical protein M9H77_05726 [Catharanthus roseus]|uniref:Uncharacterized protein n=1 Tax=Catharanthus roseus TaxID=4058 RepID=A0ACC0CI51_CATRO|nr:hypothetical protein M9H77_05726 [Catharanthus roseus]
MEILHRYYRIISSLFLFLLNFSLSSQEEYYINCGSSSTITLGRRTFIGDENSNFFRGQSSISKNPNSSSNSPSLYDTARVFRKKSWYEFDIVENGTYIVRLHFLAFTSQENLLDAKFNVSASGFPLLSVKNGSNSPLVEEFLLTINQGKFKIDLIPYGSSSLGFVNAIEVVFTPVSPRLLLPDFAPRITSLGSSDGHYNGLLSKALHVIKRVNIGGDIITPDNDTLPRNWVPDDEFLLIPDSAKKWSQTERPNYKEEWATAYDAPDLVYETAKVMNTSPGNKLFNISWRFGVSKNDKFLVRAHFCDVVSLHLSNNIYFNLYIYGDYSQRIDPYDGGSRAMLAVPFYFDFVIDSDDSGFMNISVGPRNDSPNQTAFLNGLEIMKLITNDGSIRDGNGGSKKKMFIIIGSVIGGTIFVMILLVVFILFALKRRKGKSVETFEELFPAFNWGSSHSRTTQKNDYGSPMQVLNLGLKVPFADILFATNDFDEKMVIGEGGFGKVYKGTLRNGTKVAVKRSEPGKGQGLPEFQTEIMVLSKIRHRHLVSLIGYCDERSEMILVYEFMEKGTLREHLYTSKEESKRPGLALGVFSWEKRLQLSIDAAEGLRYLHDGIDGGIIHRDIKSTNILLDEHYVAKVSDFGISRSGHLDESHISTDVKGSFGYLDPEYYKSFQLTKKSDVFSFGVVLLELLCARAPIDKSLPGDEVNLADWGSSCIVKGEVEKLIDPSLVGTINPNSLRKFGEIVEKCLQEQAVHRPSMVDVLWDLKYALQLQRTEVPRQPYEDSRTDISSNLPVPFLTHRLPSQSLPMSDTDEMALKPYESDTSYTNASEVFSQLKIDEAR